MASLIDEIARRFRPRVGDGMALGPADPRPPPRRVPPSSGTPAKPRKPVGDNVLQPRPAPGGTTPARPPSRTPSGVFNPVDPTHYDQWSEGWLYLPVKQDGPDDGIAARWLNAGHLWKEALQQVFFTPAMRAKANRNQKVASTINQISRSGRFSDMGDWALDPQALTSQDLLRLRGVAQFESDKKFIDAALVARRKREMKNQRHAEEAKRPSAPKESAAKGQAPSSRALSRHARHKGSAPPLSSGWSPAPNWSFELFGKRKRKRNHRARRGRLH
jgi:hypothetical protein